jgi:hypothetical protein
MEPSSIHRRFAPVLPILSLLAIAALTVGCAGAFGGVGAGPATPTAQPTAQPPAAAEVASPVPDTVTTTAPSTVVEPVAPPVAGGGFMPPSSGSPGEGQTPSGPNKAVPVPVPPVSPDGASPAKPDPKVVALHRQAWDHITVSGDGKTLDVYFWGGSPECYGLGRVDVSTTNGTLTVQLWTGTQPDAVGKACTDIAQSFVTTVTLDSPLIGGGAS